MSWQKVKLDELLEQVKEKVLIDDGKEYKLVTVSNKGIIKQREIVKGLKIKAKSAFKAKAGAFIYSRLSVHSGAFGIIPLELNGAILTSEMPIFQIGEKILPDFLIYSLQLPTFKFQLEQLTKGVGRTRVKEANFLDLTIDLPNTTEQKEVIKKLKKTENHNGEILSELTHQLELVKKLRQQLLQDAIQGKLVPQNPNDEPGSELLKKIKAKKQKLITEKKIKKGKELPPIKPEEIPFEIPESWVWCRLGQIIYDTEGGKSPNCLHEPAKDNEWGVIKTTAVQEMYFLENENKVLPSNFIVSEKHKVVEGDILITRAGPKNRVGVVCYVENLTKNLILSDKTIRIKHPKKLLFSKFVALALNNPLLKPLIENKMTGMADSQVNISQDSMKGFPIPLPPVSEQIRIVQKLNELIHYCDELESSIKESELQNKRLLQQVLTEAFGREPVVD